MASKNFAINTEPHVATVGTTQLLFEPEVIGAEFAQAYDEIRKVQQKLNDRQGGKASSTKHAKAEALDVATLTEVSDSMRKFVSRFLLPESQPVFDDMRLPDRVLTQLMEWVAELYGGGSGNPDGAGGTSSD